MAVQIGFYGLEDVREDLIVNVGTELVYQRIRETSAAWSAEVMAVMAVLAERTTAKEERVLLPGSGTLEPLDEWGNPQPRKVAGYYEVGYPIQGGGFAWGTNRVSRAMMSVQQAERNTAMAFDADADWLRRHIIAAMLDNTSWTFTDKQYPNDSSVTVQPLANGDAVVYQKSGTTSGTDTHYQVLGAALADANDPFDAIYSDLDEHPSNSGPYYAYVPTNQVSAVTGLTALIPPANPNIIYADTTARTTMGINTDMGRIGTSPTGLGQRYLGMHESGIHFIEWTALPDDNFIIHASGATSDVTSQAGAVLKLREYPVASLQGLFPEFANLDGNLQNNRLIRYAGFGVANRVAAYVLQIDSDNSQTGTYAIPTGYATPLAV